MAESKMTREDYRYECEQLRAENKRLKEAQQQWNDEMCRLCQEKYKPKYERLRKSSKNWGRRCGMLSNDNKRLKEKLRYVRSIYHDLGDDFSELCRSKEVLRKAIEEAVALYEKYASWYEDAPASEVTPILKKALEAIPSAEAIDRKRCPTENIRLGGPKIISKKRKQEGKA